MRLPKRNFASRTNDSGPLERRLIAPRSKLILPRGADDDGPESDEHDRRAELWRELRHRRFDAVALARAQHSIGNGQGPLLK